ncbi:hypothetical protein ACXR0O_12235 [Verrucomicrobiota bacterium sgz303538]
MNYSKITHVLLGGAVLLALLLVYLGLLHLGQSTLSPLQWLLFGAFGVALLLMAFLPSMVRRFRGMPQEAISPSDFRFTMAVAGILCPVAFFAVWVFGAYGAIIIAFAPAIFMFRSSSRAQGSSK